MTDEEDNHNFVGFHEIVTHIGLAVRPYVEGERVFKSKYVMYCGVYSSTTDKTTIIALCLQSTSPYDNPHEITFEIKDKKLNSVLCTCVAGALGNCKHSVAVLINLNRVPAAVIQEATCTDLKQLWGKLRNDVKKMYEAVPISQFCHFKKKEKNKFFRIKSEIGCDLREILLRGKKVFQIKFLCV